jgi:hypothetical protein
MQRNLHTSGTPAAMLTRLITAVVATLELASVLGCNGETTEQADLSAYDGTVGDAVIEFVDTIGALADILADIDDLEDCDEAQQPIAFQVNRLRDLHRLIGGMSVEVWAEMPRSLDEKRRAAIRRFNAEAVRVLINRERAAVLRDVIADVPALIYPETQG